MDTSTIYTREHFLEDLLWSLNEQEFLELFGISKKQAENDSNIWNESLEYSYNIFIQEWNYQFENVETAKTLIAE